MPLQQTSGNATSDSYGGGAAVIPNYIEEVFSTYLYTGNGSAQTISNGIDLAGNGGLVWRKSRNNTGLTYYDHTLQDTVNGLSYDLSSNKTNGLNTSTNNYGYLSSFNNNGFSMYADNNVQKAYNNSGTPYASWTFRKQPKFFDVVTYTGNGANRTISHNLDSTPGCIIVKRTDTNGNWQVYHNSLTSAAYSIQLNLTSAQASATTVWNSTAPTSSVFSLGTDATVNASGGTYVAYIFAHNAGGFGLTGTDNVISCGSYTTNASAAGSVNLGWEPQYVIVKRADGLGGNWQVFDSMRGFNMTSTVGLRPNTSDAEFGQPWINPTATGFVDNGAVAASGTVIYIAIRRPMKVPTSGTSVFSPTAGADQSFISTGFPVDMFMDALRTGNSNNTVVASRLTGTNSLSTASTAAEATTLLSSTVTWQSNTGYTPFVFGSNVNGLQYAFRRAPGFFDVVCYTGTGVAGTVNHNLGVAPELMIVKGRNNNGTAGTLYWGVYAAALGATKYLILNATGAAGTATSYWNDTSPTSSVFTIGSPNVTVNGSGNNYIAYLFATCAGVSKVGSYTGNGSTQTINCGFTGGARFILIKRTDSTGDWYVWDSARGIVAANDPHLSLNTTAAEVTTDDSIDPDSTGFIVNQVAATNINVTSATYIFLAVA